MRMKMNFTISAPKQTSLVLPVAVPVALAACAPCTCALDHRLAALGCVAVGVEPQSFRRSGTATLLRTTMSRVLLLRLGSGAPDSFRVVETWKNERGASSPMSASAILV